MNPPYRQIRAACDESGVDSAEAASGALPQATGSRRIAWAAVPEEVATGIERLLGSRVVAAGGYV
jgi:hypothetical protein